MISIRSALCRCTIARRNTPFAASNIPFLPSSSSSSEQTKTDNGKSSPDSVRYMSTHMVSPAYRRYQKKKSRSRYRIPSHEPGIQEPCIAVAKAMGETLSEVDNEPLMVIAEMGSFSAREEVLRRNIMAVDEVDYKVAGKILEQIHKNCKCGLFAYTVPYKFGIAMGGLAAIGIFPMAYHLDTAQWFADKYVDMHDLPCEPQIEASLFQIGHWTSNWVGPFTGALSFSMLAIQYARHQMINLGIKPFTARIHKRRTRLLIEEYPKYSERLLRNYVEAFPMVQESFLEYCRTRWSASK